MFHTSITLGRKSSGISSGWHVQDSAWIFANLALVHISLFSHFQSSAIPTFRRYSRNCNIALLDCERLMTL